MANSAQARKRARQAEATRACATRARSPSCAPPVKKVKKAIASGDKTAATKQFVESQSVIDRITDKKVVHKNLASRTKSRLVRPSRRSRRASGRCPSQDIPRAPQQAPLAFWAARRQLWRHKSCLAVARIDPCRGRLAGPQAHLPAQRRSPAMTASTAPAPSAPNPVPSDPAVTTSGDPFPGPGNRDGARRGGVSPSADADLRSVAWAELTVAVPSPVLHRRADRCRGVAAACRAPLRHARASGAGSCWPKSVPRGSMIAQQAPLPARAKLDALQAEAMSGCPPRIASGYSMHSGRRIFTPTRSTRRSATCTRRWNRCGRSISRRNCRR